MVHKLASTISIKRKRIVLILLAVISVLSLMYSYALFSDRIGAQLYLTIAPWKGEPILQEWKASSTADFHQYRSTVESITFLEEYDESSDLFQSKTEGPWDVSHAQDESVMAYMVDTAVYICSNVGKKAEVIANPYSSYAFYGFSKMTSFNNSSSLNTEHVITMKSMFEVCTGIRTLDLSTWNTTSVTSLERTFANCHRLSSLSVEKQELSDSNGDPYVAWDTGNVTTLNSTFNACGLEAIDLTSWDTGKVEDFRYTFASNQNLTELDLSTWDTGSAIYMGSDETNGTTGGMFEGCSGLTSLDISSNPITMHGRTYTSWDTSNVKTMAFMFARCSSLPSLDVSDLETGNVEYMFAMFYHCDSLETLPIDNWDTSNVILFGLYLNDARTFGMFEECSSLRTLDLSQWQTGSAYQFTGMFDRCESLQILDLSQWDVANGRYFFKMFSDCTQMENLFLLDWSTRKATNMGYMFYNCYQLMSIDVGSFDTHNVTDMRFMFSHCERIQELDVRQFDTNAISSSTYLTGFASYCQELTKITLGEQFGQENIIPAAGLDSGMFYVAAPYSADNKLMTSLEGANEVMAKNAYAWGTDNREFPSTPILAPNTTWFLGDDRLSDTDSSINNVTQVRAIEIYNTYEPTGEESLSWDASAAQDGSVTGYLEDDTLILAGNGYGKIFANPDSERAFSFTGQDGQDDYTSNLTSIHGIALLDTSMAMDMSSMFADDIALTTINLKTFNTSNVTNTSNMFSSCEQLTTLDLTAFDTAKVDNMSYMFDGCSALDTLTTDDSFVMDAVTNTSGMFRNCSVLPSINLSQWNLSQVTESASMFEGCSTFTELTIPASLKVIGDRFAYECQNLTKFTFEHAAGDEISLPVPGADTGAFYVGDPYSDTNLLATDYIADHEEIQAYEWLTDHRGVPAKLDPPILASSNTWYTQDVASDTTRTAKSAITSITLVDTYTPEASNVIESWDASDGMVGTITAYIEPDGSGTTGKYKLTLAGNGYGKIFANPTSSYAFSGSSSSAQFRYVTSINNLSLLDTSKATTMESMFYYLSSMTSTPDTANWDTSKVTSMYGMFYDCAKMEAAPDTSKWETDQVTTMSYMFSDCEAMASTPDTSSWVTDNVKSMSYLFDDCKKMPTAPDTSGWNTANVTSTSYMFKNCKLMATTPVTSGWNTAKVTTMSYMFDDCMVMPDAPDTSNWDTGNVTTMKMMFSSCYVMANAPDTSDWNTAKVRNLNGTFQGLKAITTPPDVSKWNTSACTTINSLFDACNNMSTPDVATKIIQVSDTESYTAWNTAKVTDMTGTFANCNVMVDPPDTSGWNTAKVTSMNQMFVECNAMRTGPVMTNWNTSLVRDMEHMFRSCTAMTSLDVSSFDTSNIGANTLYCDACYAEDHYITHLNGFASFCPNLKTIKLGPNFGQSDTISAPYLNTVCDYIESMFFTDSARLATTVIGANEIMSEYDWYSDRRTVTFTDAVSVAENSVNAVAEYQLQRDTNTSDTSTDSNTEDLNCDGSCEDPSSSELPSDVSSEEDSNQEEDNSQPSDSEEGETSPPPAQEDSTTESGSESDPSDEQSESEQPSEAPQEGQPESEGAPGSQTGDPPEITEETPSAETDANQPFDPTT